MVALPEPLPYDYVDEYLAKKFRFSERTSSDGVVIAFARPHNGLIGNHVGLMFSIKDDMVWETEDEDGYAAWYGRSDFDEDTMKAWGGATLYDDLPYEFTGVN